MIFEAGISARSTEYLSVLTAKCNLSEFNFLAFSVFGYDHKAPEVLNQGFPCPRQTAVLWTVEFHLLEAEDYVALVFAFVYFPDWSLV